MLISSTAVDAFIHRPFNDYKWLKKLSRAEIERELAYLALRPVFKTEPWLHQLVCFYIALCEPDFIFLLDMGLGKSKIIQDIITHRLRQKRIRRALVTVPRLINIDSWLDDVERHSDLEPNPVMVEDIGEKWRLLSEPRGDLTIIDYHGLALATCYKKKGKLYKDPKKIEHLQRIYSGLQAYDESHKLANWDSLWFSICSDLSAAARYRYGATGTLFGHDPIGAAPQFYLIDRGETFGENEALMRKAFFTGKVDQFRGTKWTFDRRKSRLLYRMIGNRSLRYEDSEVQELPKMQRIPLRLEMGEEQREHYMRALDGLIDAKSSGNPEKMEAPYVKLRQISSGYLRWRDELGPHEIRFKHNPKLSALERLIDEMGDSKIIIPYVYTPTGQLISDRLAELGINHEWLYGGTKDKVACRRRFMEDRRCRAFVMNAEAGGTGNDGLQKVARYLYFFESPTSPITRKQTEKRMHRPGQEWRSYCYDPILKRGGDQKILDNINEGRDLYEEIVGGRISRSDFLTG